MGLFKPDKHHQFEFVKPDPDLLRVLYYDSQLNQINKMQSPNKKPHQNSVSQSDPSQKFPFPPKYFQNLSLFLKNGNNQSFIPFTNFITMYALLTKLPPHSQIYSQVLFSLLAKGLPFLPLLQFKHFLSTITLDIPQLENLFLAMNKQSPKKTTKQQSTPPIFVLPSLIQQQQFTKYLQIINSSQVCAKSLSTFQQSFSLLNNNRKIFEQFHQLKQLLIEEEINELKNYSQEVFVVSKKWYDNFFQLFHKIYDTQVSKAQKKQSKSNFIQFKTNKSPKKDKKSYSLTIIKNDLVSESNLYVLLKSQFIDNTDIEGEFQIQLKQQKNPSLSFKILSQQLYEKIQFFLQSGVVKLNPIQKAQNKKKEKRAVEYRRRVQQGGHVEYNPVMILMVEVDKKGQLDQKETLQVLASKNTTLKQVKAQQPHWREQEGVTFFVKHFEEKNFREEPNNMAKIRELTGQNSKLIIAITTNRLGFIQKNTRKQRTKNNIMVGDKVYAYSERHGALLPAYVLGNNTSTLEVKVHFIGKSWREEVWLKTESIFLLKEQIEDEKKRPNQYIQLYPALLNIGNTCYINSSIQALLSTTIFSTLLSCQPMNTKLFSYQLQMVFEHLQSPVLPQKQVRSSKEGIEIRFKRGMNDFFKQFMHWQQQDAQEFIHAILDKVSEEQKLFIEKIFRFWIENQLICASKTCSEKKINREAMTMITLPIPEPKQIYVEIILVPVDRDRLQKLFIRLHQEATLGELLRKFQQRSGLQSNRVVMVEIDNGALKTLRPELTQSLKDSNSVTLKQLGIVANYNLAAYEMVREQKLHDLVKRKNRTNEKKQYFDFFIKEAKRWTIAKIPKLNASTVLVEYLTNDREIIEARIPKVQIENKSYAIESLGARTLQSEQFHVKLFMRKLVQSTVNNGRVIENFGFPFMITLPVWSSYNDALAIIFEQVESVVTKAERNEDYTIRFLQPKRQKCIFCSKELSRVFDHNDDLLKKCCKVLQSQTPILFLASSTSFVIYLDWKNLNHYNSSFSSSLGMDRACKATEEQFKEQKVSLHECFDMLRIREEVEMTCETCKHPKMYRQQSISTLPPILIIQLKEYRFINEKETMVKLNTNLHYNEVKKIDIEPFLAPNSVLRDSYNFSSVYELYSVIQHMGSGNSGHYTVTCKRKLAGSEQEVWVFFDDSHSQIVDESQIQNYMNNAYMLFYRKQYLSVDARLRLNLI